MSSNDHDEITSLSPSLVMNDTSQEHNDLSSTVSSVLESATNNTYSMTSYKTKRRVYGISADALNPNESVAANVSSSTDTSSSSSGNIVETPVTHDDVDEDDDESIATKACDVIDDDHNEDLFHMDDGSDIDVDLHSHSDVDDWNSIEDVNTLNEGKINGNNEMDNSEGGESTQTLGDGNNEEDGGVKPDDEDADEGNIQSDYDDSDPEPEPKIEIRRSRLKQKKTNTDEQMPSSDVDKQEMENGDNASLSSTNDKNNEDDKLNDLEQIKNIDDEYNHEEMNENNLEATENTRDDEESSSPVSKIEPCQPSGRDLRKVVRQIFQQFPDKNKITIKQFRKLVEKKCGVKLDKDNKKAFKNDLIFLMNSDEDYEGSDDDGNQFNEFSDYEDDEQEKLVKKRRTRKGRKKNKTSTSKQDEDDTDSDTSERSSHVKRSKRSPKGSRKPSHLKIHLEMRRKKQLEEDRVRSEELKAAHQQKVSEEDRKRAEMIAQKFETNTEEARIQRIEDRIGLLGRLDEKRLITLASFDDESDEEDEDVKLSVLASQNIEDKYHNLVSSHHIDSEGDNKANDGQDKRNYENEDEDNSGDDDESDDELELVVTKTQKISTQRTSPGELQVVGNKTKNNSPNSVLNYFGCMAKSSDKSSLNEAKLVAAKKKTSFANPRLALRNALRHKQFEKGNKWLARELGYEKPEDHIRDCKRKEKQKKKQSLLKENERHRLAQKRNENLKSLVKDETLPEVSNSNPNEEETLTERTLVKPDVESDVEDEEEDEEMALAREIESQQNLPATNDANAEDEISALEGNESLNENTDDAGDQKEHEPSEINEVDVSLKNDGNIHDNTHITDDESSNLAGINDASGKSSITNEDSVSNVEVDEISNIEASGIPLEATDMGETNVEELETKEKENRPRNSAWKAMLEKEKQALKKQKAMRAKGQAVDDEAEEEEEEEGVAGLEDFGFTVKSKTKGDDEEENENDDGDDEDFENIVDDISDNEGDEDAGERGRQALQQKEEKMRHKEVLRRIREGYDGKRGGVAGGTSARGNIRFDELVAADNKDDAKRLGLLNDDELDSEDEIGQGDGDEEVEDEQVLLDRMLKERHVNGVSVPQENFSDSEDESDNEQDEDSKQNIEEDDDDKEQERLAKRFAR